MWELPEPRSRHRVSTTWGAYVIESLKITSVEPFGDRPYEWVVARAHYAVDPTDPGGVRVTDLDLVPRDGDGKVRFTGDVVMLRPTRDGNGRALVVVPNRGMVMLPFSGSVAPVGTTSRPSEGDGYLLEQVAVAVPGGQWDVPEGFVGLRPPVLEVEPGWLRSDFRIEVSTQQRSLGDVLLAGPGMPQIAFSAYPTADLHDPEAVLRVRVAQMGPSRDIPRSEWEFTTPARCTLARNPAN
jgi:hypothetical protein